MSSSIKYIKNGLENGFTHPMNEEMRRLISSTITPEGIVVHLDHVGRTCGEHFIYKIFQYLRNVNSVYMPVHFLLLLVRLKTSKENKKNIIKIFFTGLAKSNAFAAGMASSITFSACHLSRIIGPSRPFHVWVVSLVFTLFIFFESHKRWGEISVNVLANWFESCVKS